MFAQEPSVYLLRKMWRFAENNRKKIVLFVTMSLVANVLMLAGPVIFGAIIGEIQKNGLSDGNIRYLMLLVMYIFLKEFFFWCFHGPARVIERMVAFKTMLNYRRYLLSGLLGLGLSWHNEHDSGDTIDRVDKAGEGLLNFAENVFQIVEILVKLVGTTVVLFFFSKAVATFVFAFSVLSMGIIFLFDLRLIPQYQKLNEFSNKAHAAVFDALSNITTVKILHIEESILHGVINRYRAQKNLFFKNAKLNEYKWFTGLLLFHVVLTVPLGLTIYFHFTGGEEIDAGALSTLFLYLSELMFVFHRFASVYEQIIIQKNRVANVAPIEKAFLSKESIARTTAKLDWRVIALSQLNFAYDDEQARNTLDNIHFTIQRGERIAIIGESGSGKTTFLKVLHGAHPEATAQMSIDSDLPFATNFADLDLRTMLVPQEPEIFSSTMRENITLGLDYTDEQVIDSAQLAAFDKVIANLPKGLDSVVNEKGVNLSGGQKQRLALTRALLFASPKDLILLDESTSSVDPENEYEIYQSIWQRFSDKTIIASIHKMNLLKLFDRIVMFEHGRIADEGTFTTLLDRNEKFRIMWEDFIAQR